MYIDRNPCTTIGFLAIVVGIVWQTVFDILLIDALGQGYPLVMFNIYFYMKNKSETKH